MPRLTGVDRRGPGGMSGGVPPGGLIHFAFQGIASPGEMMAATRRQKGARRIQGAARFMEATELMRRARWEGQRAVCRGRSLRTERGPILLQGAGRSRALRTRGREGAGFPPTRPQLRPGAPNRIGLGTAGDLGGLGNIPRWNARRTVGGRRQLILVPTARVHSGTVPSLLLVGNVRGCVAGRDGTVTVTGVVVVAWRPLFFRRVECDRDEQFAGVVRFRLPGKRGVTVASVGTRGKD